MATMFDVVSPSPAATNASSSGPSISADGNLVAFQSAIPTTVDYQVYVRNETTQGLTEVSKTNGGTPGNSSSDNAAISSDGSSVAFDSDASNFTTDNPNGFNNVYVSRLGALSRVSESSTHVSDSLAYDGALSADGSVVTFETNSANLGYTNTTTADQVFVKYVASGAVRRVSETAAGAQANDRSSADSISADGSVVIFDSRATNLGAPSSSTRLYAKNLSSGTLQIVGDTAAGVVANSTVSAGSVSSDGRLVAFDSDATNLSTAATDGHEQIYVKNLATGGLTLVSQTAFGTVSTGDSFNAQISGDGKYVLFESDATNLGVPGNPSGTYQLYVKNLETGTLTLLSKDGTNTPGNGSSTSGRPSQHAFSADDTKIVFSTQATNLATIGTGATVVLRASTPAPTLTLDPVTGDNYVNGSEPAAALTISGTSDQVGKYVVVSLDTAQPSIGFGLVQANDTWSITYDASMVPQGTHTVLASVQGGSYLSTDASETVIFDSVAPVLTITTPAGTTDQASQTITGTAGIQDAGTIVYLYDNEGTDPVGSGTVASDGTFAIAATLAQGANSLVAADTDFAGNTGVSDPVTLTYTPGAGAPNPTGGGAPPAGGTPPTTADTIPPVIAFDPNGLRFASATIATVTGVVSDDVGIASVEIFGNGNDLGAAAIAADGSFTFTHDYGSGTTTSLSALATDTSGNQTGVGSDFDVSTVSGPGYAATQDSYDGAGNFVGQTFFKKNGGVAFESVYQVQDNGDQSYTYINGERGTFFNNKSYYAYTDTYTADGDFGVETVYGKDGTQTISAYGDDRTVTSISDDTMRGFGNNEHYVFTTDFGHDTITNFKTSGPGFDSISISKADLPSRDAGKLANLIAAIPNDPAGITIPLAHGDSITLLGVSKADLLSEYAQHPKAFRLTA